MKQKIKVDSIVSEDNVIILLTLKVIKMQKKNIKDKIER